MRGATTFALFDARLWSPPGTTCSLASGIRRSRWSPTETGLIGSESPQIRSVWKLISIVRSPIGSFKLPHVYAGRGDCQDQPPNLGRSTKSDAGSNDAAHRLGHQIDRTINTDVHKANEVVDARDRWIMGLITEAGPA